MSRLTFAALVVVCLTVCFTVHTCAPGFEEWGRNFPKDPVMPGTVVKEKLVPRGR